ncbi:MAG: hypothetical protein ACYC28_14345 [Longimicrobiales bacterium]
MTRALRQIALAILLLAACASLWPVVVSGGAPDLAPTLAVRPSLSDSTSLDVRVQWQASRAQRGATVDLYEGSVTVNGAITATFSTAELSAVVTIDRPLPGDTAYIVASVVAVDSRGERGEAGESAPLVYIEPVQGPTPPVVEIDTVAVAPVDDLSVLECGDTWCDLAWGAAENANAYAVQVIATEPAELLEDVDNVMEAVAMVPPGADSVRWSLTHPVTQQLAGHLTRITVREGTCAWPVQLVADGQVRCRVEGLRPAQFYTYLVYSARLTE